MQLIHLRFPRLFLRYTGTKVRAFKKKESAYEQTNALRSFLRAYENAMDAISVLGNYDLNESVDMIYARFNAAEGNSPMVTRPNL